MKLWRVAALAAFISGLTILSAHAWLIDRRWLPVAGSAVPAEGPLTTLVRGNIEDQTMIVHWNCGQASPCIVTGDQFSIDGWTALMVAPEGANTPAPYFMFGVRSECIPEFGERALMGFWMQSNGDIVMQQCFNLAESRYTMRPNRPPVERVMRAQLPSNIAELTATARARARARARTTP